MPNNLRVLGIDPGLNATGWGVVEENGQSLRHIAHGVVTTNGGAGAAARLAHIHQSLVAVIERHAPSQAAVEETFANANAKSSMQLREARGAALAALGGAKLPVANFAPNTIKKTVCGQGHANKQQVLALVKVLLRIDEVEATDAADALAAAICRIHHNRYNLSR